MRLRRFDWWDRRGNPGESDVECRWGCGGLEHDLSILNTRELIGVVEEQTPGVKRRVLNGVI